MKGAKVVLTGSTGMRRISTSSPRTTPDANFAVDASSVGRGEVAVSDETVDSRLRTDPATVSIPIILVSASLPPHPASDAAFAGADLHIKKPFGPTELPERVRDVLQRTAAK